MLHRTIVNARILFLFGGALALPLLLGSCSKMLSRPPSQLGPPALVMAENEPRLWLLVKQEEQKVRIVGQSRRASGTTVSETLYHFDLQAHDTHTTDRVWKTRLLTLKGEDGGHSAQARILGQDGNIVWLFLRDQPVAVSAKDGSRLADGAAIEERNASLRGLMPKELKYFTFDNGLIITAADAHRHKVRAADYVAEPYSPASEEQFTRLQYMSATWNGGYRTRDFLVQHAQLGGRWLGLYTEKEATDAGNDEFGDHLTDPTRVLLEGARARRTFWTARIGKTREFTEGAHDRLFDLTRAPGAADFLEAGLLIRAGTRQPLLLQNPEGLLVLHRTRIDAEGRLALTRLDTELREKWSSTLPIQELRNRFEFPDRLLMCGAVELTKEGVTGWQEFVIATQLSDGATQAWNVTLERRVAQTN